MSGCGTFKCAKRLYDGHGTSSYRPSNPQLSSETAMRLSQIQMERDAQDRLWQCPTASQTSSIVDRGNNIPERVLPKLPERDAIDTPYVAHPVWPKSFQTK